MSIDGGGTPVWGPNGRELFYKRGAALFTVPVEISSGTFEPGAPIQLFDGPFDGLQSYDVFPDGEHFLMVEVEPDARPSRIQIVQHWFDELQRLVPID